MIQQDQNPASPAAATVERSRWSRAPRVLIVEDERAIAELIRYNLGKNGYLCQVAGDGEEALLAVEEQVPDLIILDWMLPEVSGIEVCRRLRARPQTRSVPIIMVTARSEEADMLRGFREGADDYMRKPFSLNELNARVDAALRRTRVTHQAHLLEVGDLLLDAEALTVSRAGKRLHLAPTEFRLLQALMSAPGRVLSRDHLLSQVWGLDSEVEARTVDVHVRRLRQALNGEGGNGQPQHDYIRTVRGAGYSIEAS
jgi:two-component system phosphate regulon response regulator PhoB